ncbi:hypothetical protein HK104_007712, partial [Borealophlyctis nickersoniae]
ILRNCAEGDTWYIRVWRTILLLQAAVYLAGLVRAFFNLSYTPAAASSNAAHNTTATNSFPLKNHIGNVGSYNAHPNAFAAVAHLAFAIIWDVSVIGMKHLVRIAGWHVRKRGGRTCGASGGRKDRLTGLGKGGETEATTRAPLAARFFTARTALLAHGLLGTFLCAVALLSIVTGTAMAMFALSPGGARTILILTPLYMAPSVFLTWYTGRQAKQTDAGDWTHEHRFWATIAFVVPPVANFFADWCIWGLGKVVGHELGSTLGIAMGGMITGVVLAGPAGFELLHARRGAVSHVGKQR